MRTQLILALAVSVLAVAVRVNALRYLLPPERSSSKTERVAAAPATERVAAAPAADRGWVDAFKRALRRPAPLSSENEQVAGALADGRGWADAFDRSTGPTAHTAPLYPLMLAGIYRLCGDYSTATRQFVQSGLTLALTVLALLFLPVLAGKLGFSRTAGWMAAFLAAALPFNALVELTGRHENTVAMLALLGLIWCLDDLRRRNWSGRAARLRTGALLGLLVLLSPNFLLVPVLFFTAELAWNRAERGRILRCGALLATMVLLAATPWMVRNYRVLGGFVPLRSNFGLELAVGNRPGADGYTHAEGMEDIHPFYSAAERARLIEQGELTYMRAKQHQAQSWIGEHPRQFVWLTMRRAWLFWVLPEEVWLKIDPAYLPLCIAIYTTLAGAAFVEVLRLLGKNPPLGRLLACVVLGIGLPYLVTHVEQRYRLPLAVLYPLLSLNLGAVLLSGLRHKLLDLVAAARTSSGKLEEIEARANP
jgi:hypothetical protein